MSTAVASTSRSRGRSTRICIRCGRTGSYAFRRVVSNGAQRWVCSHTDTCLARMRAERRSSARAAGGRPATSPIAPTDLSEKSACVIGAEPESTSMLAEVLTEYMATDVDVVTLDRRGIERLSRRDYGLIVIDAQAGDPVALVNELDRRLPVLKQRGVPVVVCVSLGHSGPAVEGMVSHTGALRVTRPFDAGTFMQVVADALGTGLAGETAS